MDVFEALGAPHRRRIVELVSSEERTAGEIAAHFDISRPGVSQHLTALVSAGVLIVRRTGRERRYSLHADALAEAGSWLEAQRVRWNDALDRLEREIAAEDLGAAPDQRGTP
ncbi:metalloregulator ArsR/SmtB family transcription factor [Isoptericola halotolerans]|uniref:DNA-binding transcriptional ArsR family regulator n=1 Tax=Isoptericola halotolerans TaxID=300560 RepID=A0ABX2A2Q0_9MICO|nr:metalloregulator ArsR/SmtB family transcription factor [Isoptericola halotolerans]NOV97020.1 DNA-binding transcriptional ArsR family regulator [Isoptericola halotolerans]